MPAPRHAPEKVGGSSTYLSGPSCSVLAVRFPFKHHDEKAAEKQHGRGPCQRRGTLRKKWEVLPHIYRARPVPFLLCDSRLNITMRKPPRSSMVAAPASRMMLVTTAPYRPVLGS